MAGVTFTGTNVTIATKTAIGAVLTFATGVEGTALFSSTLPITSGDWSFMRLKMRTNADIIIKIVSFATYGSIDYSQRFRLYAGKDYDLCYRSGVYGTSGNFRMQIETVSAESSGQVLTIDDFMVVKNSVEAWRDHDTYVTLKDFTSRELVVDANGGGHFFDINSACIYAKRAFDVTNVPVTINIKNGYYLQEPTNTYPYAPINKGANRISLIGESRNGVVIECYNTATKQSKVIDIGGDCTVANLTIRSLNDGTYNSGNDLEHNCYCIHNDSGTETVTAPYTTLVKNCKLYSTCADPVGAGLHNYQTQRYEDCDIVINATIQGYAALYVHGPVNTAAGNMRVEIVRCSCVALDGRKAITLPDVVGSPQYTTIPVMLQNNIGYTTGANVTDINFKELHLLQPQSALNNISVWNY
jgi:hypothetical protein